MAISESDIQYVARLGHLAVSDSEVRQLTGQLRDILGYADQLSSLSTEGITPTAHAIPQKTLFRDDVVTPFDNTVQLMANAPALESPFFGVPKMAS